MLYVSNRARQSKIDTCIADVVTSVGTSMYKHTFRISSLLFTTGIYDRKPAHFAHGNSRKRLGGKSAFVDGNSIQICSRMDTFSRIWSLVWILHCLGSFRSAHDIHLYRCRKSIINFLVKLVLVSARKLLAGGLQWQTNQADHSPA